MLVPTSHPVPKAWHLFAGGQSPSFLTETKLTQQTEALQFWSSARTCAYEQLDIQLLPLYQRRCSVRFGSCAKAAATYCSVT
jgi:hypothetical protein